MAESFQEGRRVADRQRLPGESNMCCRSRVIIYEQDNDSLVTDRCNSLSGCWMNSMSFQGRGMLDLPGVCGVSGDRRMLRYFAGSSAG